MKKHHSVYLNWHTQQGSSLLVAVVFLLVLALLGISATQSNILQERMSSNTRNRDLAFQAAEAALREAESTLSTWRTLAVPTYDPTIDTNTAAYWTGTADWSACTASGASCRVMGTTIAKVAAQPKYHMEKMASVSGNEYYRVTARGVGADNDTVVILQAILQYTP